MVPRSTVPASPFFAFSLHCKRLLRFLRNRVTWCIAARHGVTVGILVLTAPSVMVHAQDLGPSGGCGKHPATGVFNLTTQDSNARTRTYLVQVPPDYDGSKAYPLIFVFHGAASTAAQSYSWGLQKAAGASQSGIFVFPNGINFQHYGVGWDDRTDGYDLPLFDNMLRDLEAGYCIDKKSIFVAGFSWGGDFAIALACNRGDEIQAVAANSTNDEYKDTSNYLTYQNLPCPSKKHPRIRFEHAVGGDAQYPAPDFATTSKLFQYLNSCSPASTNVKSSTPSMSCVSYNGCSSEYIECSFDHGIGHALPPNWAQDTWEFFSAPAR
jgi:poly(3-hydroxybutyrate) depolymerase